MNILCITPRQAGKSRFIINHAADNDVVLVHNHDSAVRLHRDGCKARILAFNGLANSKHTRLFHNKRVFIDEYFFMSIEARENLKAITDHCYILDIIAVSTPNKRYKAGLVSLIRKNREHEGDFVHEERYKLDEIYNQDVVDDLYLNLLTDPRLFCYYIA